MQRQQPIPSAEQEKQLPTAQKKKFQQQTQMVLLGKYTLEDCLVLKEKNENKTDQQNRLLPYKRRGNSQNNCTPFIFWIPIIKDVPKDSGVGGHAGASPSCRDSQVEHGLAAQELPDARPQHLPPVRLPAPRTHGRVKPRKAGTPVSSVAAEK